MRATHKALRLLLAVALARRLFPAICMDRLAVALGESLKQTLLGMKVAVSARWARDAWIGPNICAVFPESNFFDVVIRF